MERWSGKVAVVTGASSGIGAAVIKALAEHGMITVGLARRVDNIKIIAEKTSGTIHAIKCDLTNPNDICDAFRWIETNLGGVDLLVNNAGVLSPNNLTEGSPEGWKKIFDVNVLALSICTKEALKTMRQRGDDGHIIHINSLASYVNSPLPSFAMYTASKHAVTVLANSLRKELSSLKSKIKVTNLCPGGVYTEMVDDAIKGIKADKGVTIDVDRNTILTSEDMADTVVCVLSMKPHILIEELALQNINAPGF